MRQQALAVVKPDDVRYPSDISTQHPLDAPPRTCLVTQGEQRHADEAVPDSPIGRIGRFRRVDAKTLGRRERRAITIAGYAVDEQAPKRSEAIIRVVEDFCDLKGSCPGR